ncbi:hypothetical protein FOA52_008379 [Chlamydomonas sp. UWO 241]|nr:hypothetical protein FOA52_008379 [Chlamydomonas sp. UWO 241]
MRVRPRADPELLEAAAVLLAVAAGPPHADGALEPTRPQQDATDAGPGGAPPDEGDDEDEATRDEMPAKMAKSASGRVARIAAAEAAAAAAAARFVGVEPAEGSRDDGQPSRGVELHLPPQSSGAPPKSGGAGSKGRRQKSSRYRGVTWNKTNASWRAQLLDPQSKRSRYIGTYSSEEDAARAYDFVAVQAHGPRAKRNFPGETASDPPVAVVKERVKSSRFAGVFWNKVTSAWYVQLYDPQAKRSRHIGTYFSEEDAARAYDCVAVQAHGPGAKRNFPGETASEPPVSKERVRSSSYLGVSFEKGSSSWLVQLYDPQTKRQYHIGAYASEEDAARAHDFAAVQAHGPRAKRNVPGEDISEPPVSRGEERKKQSSSYVGVTWHKGSSLWAVRLWDLQTKRSRHIGSYTSEEDAARAYDCAAVKAHGPSAERNFPVKDISGPVTLVEKTRRRSSRR